MGRKHSNVRPPKLGILGGTHFMYSPHENGEEATVVRYMGEQDDDRLLCFHPEGFSLWIHVHHLWRSVRMKKVA